MTLAPFIIRWGPDASSDILRGAAVCRKCGHKGATLVHPSVDIDVDGTRGLASYSAALARSADVAVRAAQSIGRNRRERDRHDG